MSRGFRFFGSAVCCAVLLAWPAAAQADWLVMRDGARLEVKGTWKASGKQIVFTALDGKLSSLRADQVDLEASARATEEANRVITDESPSDAEAQPKPKARWSLSDKDFPRTKPSSEDSTQESEKGEGRPTAPPTPKSDLEVLVWSQSVDPARNRIKVAGTLQNSGKDMAASIALEVQLIDRQGVVVGSQKATLQKASLAPGESIEFATSFPQVVFYDKVNFVPAGTMLKVEPGDVKGKAAPPDAE